MPATPSVTTDPRAAHATRDPLRFTALMAQLGALLLVFKTFRVEEPAFLVLAATAFGGFAVHYWLPFRFKEPFWILLSLGGAFVLLEHRVALLLLAFGGVFFAILAAPLPYVVRAGGVAAIFAALLYGRALHGFGLPQQFWPVFGALFMFRMLIYLYDLRHGGQRPKVRDFLRYFFLLPNYYFVLFPVIDFQTLRRSFYARDVHDVAQQGIHWIVRGTSQLLLYRLVYYLKPEATPDTVTSAGALGLAIVTTYLLYLRVSGQFHVIVGLLHLFGYDLPETHRRYFLAGSLTDFWRRINIYWKDFMVKLVYFPAYFRLRKRGEVRAQIVATLLVFVVTWLLHMYQYFWLTGQVLLSGPDVLFWMVLGLLVTGNLLLEARRRRPVASAQRVFVRPLKVAGTFALLAVLWSMWNAPSMRAWFELLTWWQVG
ncbi:MAG: hypothetical protein HY699_12840 [Deltaproteobacteria bacterium]|nr:hypothetical protein [Deltaproteobacteria bacterium]